MRALGYLLITAGFLAGAYLTVLDPRVVSWTLFVPALAVGVAGVVLVQVARRRVAKAAHRLEAGAQQIETSLARIAEDILRLDEEKAALDVYDVRHKIDATFMADLDAFVQTRETIAHRFGLQAYADVMNHFAAGERYLNRCWSASADGYIDEVHEYLGRAREQFTEALAKFRALMGSATA